MPVRTIIICIWVVYNQKLMVNIVLLHPVSFHVAIFDLVAKRTGYFVPKNEKYIHKEVFSLWAFYQLRVSRASTPSGVFGNSQPRRISEQIAKEILTRCSSAVCIRSNLQLSMSLAWTISVLFGNSSWCKLQNTPDRVDARLTRSWWKAHSENAA